MKPHRTRRRGILRPCLHHGATAAVATLLAGLAIVAPDAVAAPPANDAFSAAEAIEGTTATVTGTTVDATAETEEPSVLRWGRTTRRTVWYRWTAPEDGPTTLTTCDSPSWSGSAIAVYTGSGVSDLTRVATSDSMLYDGGFQPAARCPAGSGGDGVDFDAKAGTTYRIMVEDSDWEETGRAFSLQLNPPPANDGFARPTQLDRYTPRPFNSAQATTELGEPSHAGVLGTRSLWFELPAQYYTASMTLSTCDSSFDTVMAVYRQSGTGLAGLTPVASSDDAEACGPGSKQSSLRFTPEIGIRYYVAVSGHGDGGGVGVLAAAPYNDDLAQTGWVYGETTGTTIGATLEPGESTAPPASGRSVWYRTTFDGAPRSITVDTCSVPATGQPASDTTLRVHTLTGSAEHANLTHVTSNDDAGGCGPNGLGSRVRFTTEPGAEYRIAVGTKPGAGGTFRLSVTENDDLAGATTLYADSWPVIARNIAATAQPGEPSRSGRAAARSLWYAVELSRTATYTFDTCRTTFDTVIGLYRAGGTDMDDLEELAANDDAAACTDEGGSRLTYRPEQSGTYYLAVDGAGGATGAARVSVISNDDRRDAIEWGDPNAGYFYAAISGATREAGEPDHGAAGTTRSVWYTFETATRRGIAITSGCTWSELTEREQPPATLAVYTERADGSLAEVVSAAPGDQADPCERSTRLEFAAQAGVRYFVAAAVSETTDNITVWGQTTSLNDAFADADPLPAPGQGASASNQSATREAGEPEHGGLTTVGSMWWQFTADADEPVTLDVCGRYGWNQPLDDSVLAVYTGNTLASLTPVASSDDAVVSGCEASSSRMSRLTFNATAGTTYRVAVAGKDTARGDFLLRRQGPPGNDNRSNGAYLAEFTPAAGTTVGATAEVGEPDHAGSPAKHSVWYRPYLSPGRYEVSTCNASTAPTRLAAYATGSSATPLASATPSAGCAEGRGATMTLRATTYGNVDIAVDAADAARGDFTISLRRIPSAINDDLTMATSLYSADGASSNQSTEAATREPDEPDHAGAGGSASVWYLWQPQYSSSGRTAEVDTCTATFDTAIAVYERTGSGYDGLTPVASNDDTPGCGGGTGSRVRFSAKSGVTYAIAVDGKGPAKGTFTLTYRRQPANDEFSTSLFPNLALAASGSTRLATADEGEPAHAGAAASASVWFALSPRSRVRVDTCGSSFDTRLAVYRGTALGNLVEVASNDDADGCGTGGSRIDVEADPTQTLWVAVDGKGGATGEYVIRAAPGNDRFADAQSTSSERVYLSAPLREATAEAGEPAHSDEPAAHSVWYRWTPPRSGIATLRTCGNSTVRGALYTGTQLATLAAAPQLAGTTTCPAGQSGVIRRYAVTVGTTYHLAMDQTAPPADLYGNASFSFGLQPRNDDRADATELSATSSHWETTDLATREADEPNHGLDGGSGSIWYRHTASETRDAIFSTCQSGFDTVVAVYERAQDGAITKVAENNDADGCGTGSRVRWKATAGRTYLVAVAGRNGADGSVYARFALAPVNDDIADAKVVARGDTLWNETLLHADREDGEPWHGYSGEGSVWYRYTADRTGTAAMSTCGSGNETLLAAYSGAPGSLTQLAVDGDGDRCGPGDAGSRITFPVTDGTTYYIAVANQETSTGSFQLKVDPPANDDFEDAEMLTGDRVSVQQSTRAAGGQRGEPGFTSSTSSVWFRWTAPSTSTVRMNTCGSGATIAVYEGASLGTLSTRGTTVPRDCNGTEIELGAVAGHSYAIRVEHYSSARLQINPPANDQPASATQLTGVTDTKTGTTTGASADYGEQWISTGRPVWYRWTAPDAGDVLVDACEASEPVSIEVYRQGTNGSLQVAPQPTPPAADCPAGKKGARRGFSAVKDATYLIGVDAAEPRTGTFTLVLDALLDSDPPETTISTAPPALTNASSVSFAFAADESGSTFECSFDGGAFAACKSPRSVTPAEGSRVFAVRARDRAGNVDPTPAEHRYVVDRTAPSAAFTSAPPDLGRSTRASFSFVSPESDVTFTCSFDVEAFAPCTSPVELTDIDDGRHSFRIRATDPAGNTSDPRTASFTVDTTPPVSSFTGSLPDLTNERSGEWSFQTNEPGSTFECALDGEFAPCTSPYAYSSLPDGEHTLRVRATDPAGNVETTPIEHAFTVDTAAPDTTIDTAPPTPTNRAPHYEFSASDPETTFTCSVDDEPFAPCASPQTLSVPDGEHRFRVRATDGAGNTDETPAEHTTTVDTTPPTVVVDREPDSQTAARTVSLEFHASEPGATFACSTDGAPFAPCTSPYTSADLDAEGSHTVSVRATDPAGNEGPSTDRTIIVDRAPPETELTDVPGPVTRAASVRYAFSSSEGGDAFECRLDDADFSPCASPTTLADLNEGDHTFEVRAVDAAGGRDATPARHEFEIDRTAPDTTIDAGPDAPIHGRPEFSFSSNETGDFECAIDTGEWFTCGHLTGLPTSPAGEHTFRIRAIDSAGNVDPTPATRNFTIVNAAPTATVSLDRPSGDAPHDVELLVDGADSDDDPLTYTIDWGDGARTSPASLPMAYAEHRYAKAGTYVVRVEVRDEWDSTVETTTVSVAPGEPLDARAGDDRTGPANEPIRFDAGGSRPLAGIDSYRWDFGDGSSATTAVASHSYAQPGTYEATLTVKQGDETDTDTVAVRVLPGGPAGLGITVTSGGVPIPGADTLVITPDGERIQAVTGEDGRARLRGLPDGAHSVAVYAPGYLPERAEATVTGGSGAVSVELAVGDLAEAKLTSRPMTLQEILDAGIDPNDPDNQNVYQFTVNLQLTPDGAPATFTGGFGAGGGGGSLYEFDGGGLICRSRSSCVGRSGGSTVYVRSHIGPAGQPLLTTLVIPFRASWLKEFFDVSMTVANLAEPGFTLTGGAATLELPAGLTLAPTAERQSVTKPMPDIRGGGQATARWVLRGDAEGEYRFGADYAAVLDPVGRSFTLRAELEDPLKVWGGSALQLIVDVDERARDGYPYTTRVGLKNVADVPVYNPAVELLKEGRRGYIEQPRQKRVFATQEIAPGQTFWAGPFVIVPEASGTVDLSRSFLRKTAGNVDVAGSIVTHPRVPTFDDTPNLTVTGRLNGLVFQYEAVDGASGYEAYATPDRETDFPDTPLAMRTIRPGVGYVAGVTPADTSPHYALRTLGAPRDEMLHPLATANAKSAAEYPKVTATTTTRCSERPVDIKLTFEDPIFELTQWRYRIDGGAWQEGGALAGFEHEQIVSLDVPAGEEQRYEVQVHNRDEGTDGQGIWGPIEELVVGGCAYVALGDSFSAGEGVRPYEDDTNGDDEGGRGSRCHRSRYAYANLLARVSLRKFVACSGAVSGDIRNAQNDNVGTSQWQHGAREPLNDGVGPQLDAISGSTELVTISMGGNDVGFGDILADCAFGALQDWWQRVRDLSIMPFSLACKANWAGKLSDRQMQLENDLHDAFLRIKTKAAPHARIIALGYPQIFPDYAIDKVQCWLFHPADVNWFHRMTASVNESVERAAATAGIEFVDPNAGGRFDGHSVCDDVSAYFNHAFHNIGGDVAEWRFLDKEESFHPNRAGQAALAEALQEAVDEAPGSRRAVLKPKGTWDFVSDVADDWDVLGVRIGWPGSQMALKLTSPSGTEYTTASTGPGIQTDTTPTTAEIRIKNPEPGPWKVTVTAVDVAPGGEPVTADITHATERDEPPIAIASGHTGDAVTQGTTVRYSAAGSFDPDGSISEYRWDFGDGVTRTGAEVSHTHDKAGTFTPKLTVIDNRGNTDTMPLLALTVNPKTPSDPGDGAPGGSGGGGGAGSGTPVPGPLGGVSGGQASTAPPAPLPSPSIPQAKLFGKLVVPKSVRLSELRKRGLRIRVGAVTPGVKLRSELLLSGARGRTIAVTTRTVRRSGTATLTLKPSRSAARALRRSQRLRVRLSGMLGQQRLTGATSTVTLR